LPAGSKFGNNTANDMGSMEERWQAFFANPLEWWDNRKDKVIVLANESENACIHVLLANLFLESSRVLI
jgi:hypothetical protein